MSIEGIKAAFASPVASPTQKAVMVVLGHHADSRLVAAPSISTIMACTAFSERTVRSALRALEAEGLVVRRSRTGYQGETLAAVYYLAFAAPRQPQVIRVACWERRV